MSKRVKVKLTEKQLEYAVDLAHQRNKKEKRFGSKTYVSGVTSAESHVLGMVGECVAAKFLKVKCDSRIFDHKGDDGIDLVTKEGLRVAVKSTTFLGDDKNPVYLRAEVKRDLDCIDIYILVYVSKDLKDTYVLGYITRDKMHKLAKRRKLGRFLPENYITLESDLSDPKELIS